MKNGTNIKAVREMEVRPTAHGRGLLATIELRCDDNRLWQVNGEVCGSDTEALVQVALCLDALAHEREKKRASQGAAVA
jgi:hypothetical protein